MEIIHKIYNSVSLQRGLGYSGHKISVVEKDCKYCGYDRQIETERVYPEEPSDKKYYCQNPGCINHHDSEVRKLGAKM